MKEIEIIQKLNDAAGDPPPVDVSDRVIRGIRAGQAPIPNSAVLWLPAILSTLAAAAILLIAIQSVTTLQDPFNDLLTPLWTAFQ